MCTAPKLYGSCQEIGQQKSWGTAIIVPYTPLVPYTLLVPLSAKAGGKL